MVGWAYWQFKTYADLTTSAGTGSEGFWNQDGSLQDYKVKALARSYMPITQGVLSKMHFDTNTAYMKAHFAYNEASKDVETSVYLNQEYWYPNGYTVHVAHKGSKSQTFTQKKVDGNYLTFNVAQIFENVQDGDEVTVTVYAK